MEWMLRVLLEQKMQIKNLLFSRVCKIYSFMQTLHLNAIWYAIHSVLYIGSMKAGFAHSHYSELFPCYTFRRIKTHPSKTNANSSEKRKVPHWATAYNMSFIFIDKATFYVLYSHLYSLLAFFFFLVCSKTSKTGSLAQQLSSERDLSILSYKARDRLHVKINWDKKAIPLCTMTVCFTLRTVIGK